MRRIVLVDTADWLAFGPILLGTLGLMWAILVFVMRSTAEAMRAGTDDRLDAIQQSIESLREVADTNLRALRSDVVAEVKVVVGRVEALDRDMNTRFEALDRDMNTRIEATDGKIEALRREMTTGFGSIDQQMKALQQYVDARIDAQTAEQGSQKERLAAAEAHVQLMEESLTAAGRALRGP